MRDDSTTARRPVAALLTGMIWRRRGRLAVSWLLMSLHQACEAAVPVAIGVTIDVAVATGDWTALAWCAAGIIVLFTVLALAWRFGSQQGVIAQQRELHDLRVAVARRALDPRGTDSSLSTGETLTVATSDAEKSSLILRAVSMGIAAVAGIVVSAVTLLLIDVPLGLGVLLGVPLLLGALQLIAPRLSRRSGAAQAATATATGLATDFVTGLRTLRGIGATGRAAERYRRASDDALQVSLRAASVTGVYQAVTTVLGGLFLAAVAGVAGWFALSGRLTVGELITVVGLAQFIAEPMRTLGYCGQIAAVARGSAKRVAELLGTAPLTRDAGERSRQDTTPRLTLTGIGYRGLTEVDVTVAPGESVGVVCHDPADADALLAILSRRVPESDYLGTVTCDDVPAAEIRLAEYRRVVHVEPHDTTLFEGDISENLTAGMPASARAGIEAAVAAAAATDVVASHPDGMNRHISDRGRSLSGGQRQRLGLARALAADPPILVLHDPTTAVDAATEELAAQGLAAFRSAPDRSTLLVTSSPALLGKTDRVIVLESGRVTRTGSHTDLLDSDPAYRKAVLR
ncbi:putative ABC transport system ATP-binding protein [Stackebrandtia albiflava]|uniref:Putative ABC transport system ATP-binding protein n=1 Tax=Stackebrandtia albiflava TaxID=406432 RepID=A0A562VBX1_9ACTN|nr:ABC transporter ATP-binding protein [Stackebrandtia albiflava]TWJ15358.1 putative ABC transport system ATP-binding protein [Stackebrandtia albiflava]